MLKITFWLKKSDAEQGNLEYITINDPQKVLEGKLVGMYFCQVSLPDKKGHFPIYSMNPIEALWNASEFIKVYLQGLINRGYSIIEAESKEPWKLEKRDPRVNLKEKLDEIKNSKNIPAESKAKILKIMKESFATDQLSNLADEE